MKQDNDIKQILKASARPASPAFTEMVMKKIVDSRAPLKPYQPLVPDRFRRLFIGFFVSVVTGILSICLVMSVIDTRSVLWMRNVIAVDMNYGEVVSYIVVFWMAFLLNRLFRESSSRRNRFTKGF